MYKKSPQGWLKHWDFILLDIFCLQLAFVVAYLVRQGLENPYSDQIYRTVAFVFMLCQIVVMFLGQSYQDILKRGYYIEFTKTAKHVLMVMLLSVLYLFATQQAVSYSRLTLFYTAFLYLCFDYVGRVWHKENVLKKNATKKKEKSMVVVVSLAEAKETIEKILSGPIQNFSINGLALIDDNPGVKEIAGIPVVGNMDTISEYLCHEWVDEVFVKISETEPYPQKLIDEIITMGLTVHLSLGEMEKSLSGKNFIEKIGGYSVITSSINTASPKELLYKRLMDIAGGIVGCLLTVILIVVIGPMIYIKSPGPIFFSQVRIGKNGKKFKIYKFRSMYMDAEERKAELMSQNKMEGLMFKIDYDPRIIGSEKKDKNGNPKGIGNFIRKTSLDEFPQFWNVLKGDMSLVGTRPAKADRAENRIRRYECNAYIIPCDIWCDRNPFHRHELYSWYMVSDLVDNESNVRVNRKMELVTVPESSGGNAMIGICYLVKEDADIVAKRIEELCKNQRYDGAFWEEALYNKDRMIVAARVVHSADVVEINTYEQLREIDSDSNQLKTDAIQVICEALDAKPEAVTDITVLKKGMTNRSFLFTCKGKKYIMRIPGEGTDQLINRRQEAAVYQAIDGKHICDDIAYINPENGYKITEFL